MGACQDECAFAGSGLADDVYSARAVENESDPGADDRVVVNEQNARIHGRNARPARRAGAIITILTSSSTSSPGSAVGSGASLRIAEQTADGLYIVDQDGDFTFVNPAAVALFGYENESELLGRNSHATTHYQRPDGSPYPVEDCPLLKPRLTGESVRVEDDWFFRRDGSMIPVAYSSAPFPMESGIGAVVAIRDMTELRQAEDELRLLQTATVLISAAETLEEAVGNVIREVCQESGWVAGEMWIPDDDCARLELAPAAPLPGGASDMTWMRHRPTGLCGRHTK
jgi:PAS domain S-box-containing protein